ncbi:MAG: cytochrome c [Chloroflexi bacterium]|nr:cytochrome c [Chloroflexota bacterium]
MKEHCKVLVGQPWLRGMALALVAGGVTLALLSCQPEGQKVPQSAPIASVGKTFPELPSPKTPVQVVLALPSPQTQAAPISPGPALAPTQGDAAAGRGLFNQMCNVCHPGGQKGLGPALVGVTGRLGEDGVEKVVKGGRGVMPAFAGQIGDKELADVLAYLGTLK